MMNFRIPFTFSSPEVLKKKAKSLIKYSRTRKSRFVKLEEYLKNSDVDLSKDEYISICLRTFIFVFISVLVIVSSILGVLGLPMFFLVGLGGAGVISSFILFNQMNYPKVYNSKKVRDIEKNLIAAMQDMHVQLNSGVDIFRIMINLSESAYGSVSEEFKKTVKEINSGKPQIEAIEELGDRTTSVYFRRVLWQISNGMRSGSDMAIVIKTSIGNLAKEQVIQIQNYGSRLNPIIVFYMLFGVIIPSLGITFFTLIASMINLSGGLLKGLFISVFVFIFLLQIMFMGVIRTRRPSLL